MGNERQSVLVKIGGKTGEGIDSTGEMLVYIAKECGLEVNTFRSFPSVIVGGSTAYEAHIASRPIYARGDEVHVMVAFDQESMDAIAPEMAEDGLAIFDSDSVQAFSEAKRSQQFVGLPLKKMARELGSPIVRNMIALGVVVKLLDLDLSTAKRTVENKFSAKGEKVVQSNIAALERGYEYEDEDGQLTSLFSLPTAEKKEKYFLSGNEAMAFGALAAQCRVFAGYPITPATDIMEWLARELPHFGGHVVQVEDEIAALCTVIGSNYAGVRAMTATAGPGISLMTEALGLAGATETPIVIVDTQRPGPSAGMPTKHEQSDIKHLIHGSHGEFPRIVIAPGTVKECFEDMVAAFNLADKYQCPVIVASDQDLALRKQTIAQEDIDVDSIEINRGKFADAQAASPFKRYVNTDDGISPRALPGQDDLLFLASGDAHHEDGSIDVEIPAERAKMVEKIMRKIEKMDASDYESIRLHGSAEAEHVIIGMGSTTGPILEVLQRLPNVKYLQIRRLWPFPTKEVADVLKDAESVIIVEHNYQGQLAHLVKAEIPVHDKIHHVLKYDGTPFKPKELLKEVEACLPTKIS